MKKILEDIRVLDFGRFIACPYCGMILADMGAEVIRIDRTGGEEDRNVGLLGPNGENTGYPSYARNKKGITLNLMKNEAAREVLADLVKISDVVIHNFSPYAAELIGLTYEQLTVYKKDIILAAVSCYGSDGPYANRVGFDPIAQAMSGAMSITGYPQGDPLRSQVPWVDYSTALANAVGTLLALRHRDKTGVGQMVDLSLLGTAVSFMGPIIAEAEVLGRLRPMVGNRGCYIGPSDLFQCRDDQLFSPTVYDDVAFGPRYQGFPEDKVRPLVEEALATVGMSDYAGRVSHHLSVGEKKRIAIATVLSMKPEVLALDEPTSGLDPRARRSLINLLCDLPLTMLVSTHDMLMVGELFPRMVIMDQGQIVADGPTGELMEDEALLNAHGLERPKF